jgi:predicted nucleic acid-binding protein
MTYLLDTTVLAYAAGADHPLRASAQDLMVSVASNRASATTTAEVIQEFTHVHARRHGRVAAADRANDFLQLLSPLTVVVEDDVRRALDVFVAHDRVGAFDSVLAAVALERQDLEVVTADRGFEDIVALPVLHLGDEHHRWR